MDAVDGGSVAAATGWSVCTAVPGGARTTSTNTIAAGRSREEASLHSYTSSNESAAECGGGSPDRHPASRNCDEIDTGLRRAFCISFNNGKALPPTGVPTSTPSFISTAEKKTSSAGIVGIAVGIPCFLLLGICIFLWVRRRHQKRERNSFIHLANSPKSSKNSTTTPTTTTNTSIRSSPYATTQTMTQSTNSSTRQNTHRTTSQNHSRNPSHHSQAPSTIRPDYNIPPPPRLMQRISRSFQRRSQVIDIHPGMPWSPHSYGPASPRSNPSIRPSPSPELRVRPPTPLAELETPATLAELESPISPLPLQVPQQVFVRPERERPNLAPLQIRSPSPGSSGDEFVSALSPVAAFGWGYQSELPEVVVVEEAEEHETDEERRLRETLEDTEARMEQLRMEQRRMEERRRRRQQGQ
ncbi:hypothetical protein EDC01DRAFT_632615 [Geopyxis carbonaria]|nr:hypothetical protein EDC01DRAFT_632615 [Geopyxis carbonaria]